MYKKKQKKKQGKEKKKTESKAKIIIWNTDNKFKVQNVNKTFYEIIHIIELFFVNRLSKDFKILKYSS